MPDFELTADLRPAVPPRDPFGEDDGSGLPYLLRFAGAVALGVLILTARTAIRRPFAALIAAAFLIGAIAVTGNLASQLHRHPQPLFSPVAATPVPETTGSLPNPPRPDPIGEQLAQPTPPAPAQRPRAELIRQIQDELAKRGLYQGTVDGATGPRTERAIRSFEASAGLPETGQASDRLLERLRRPRNTPSVPVPPASPRATQAPAATVAPVAPPSAPHNDAVTVLLVKKRLADLGYTPGRLSGDLTPEMKNAIERFQRDRNLTVTGVIDDRLLSEIAAVTGPLG